MSRFLISILTLALWSLIAVAQQAPPFTYPQTIGTSSVAILAANTLRRKLIFHNPNDTAKIAVCPVGPNRTAQSSQALVVAAINGAGCSTLLPYDRMEVTGTSPTGPAINSAWVGIASAPGSAITILELE
jgi:hypothetical protein